MGRLSSPSFIAAGSVVLITLSMLALGWNWFEGKFACSMDTSYCARSHSKDTIYSGTLEDRVPPGTGIYRDAEFLVDFYSRDDEPDVAFHTDTDGRFCIVWVHETIVPGASRPDGTGLFERGAEAYGLRSPVAAPSHISKDCEEGAGNVPWNRANDLKEQWQYRLMMMLPLLAIAAGAVALLGRGWRYPGLWLLVGTALLAVDTASMIMLW